MSVRGYELYLRTFNSISHSFAAHAREISSGTREDKIRTHKQACNIFLLLYYINIPMMAFRRFSKDSRRFSKS